jgi:hypothetical protein
MTGHPRTLMLLAAATLAAGSIATVSFAQSAVTTMSPPADLHPPIQLDADTLRAKLTPSHLGLKPQSGSAASNGIELPFGINYNREAKGLVVPLDQKNEWGVGVGLNINSSSTVELSPSSSLGLQPKRAPGFMLHKKF